MTRIDVRVSDQGVGYHFEPLTQAAEDFLVAGFPYDWRWAASDRGPDSQGVVLATYPEAYKLVGELRVAGLVVRELRKPGQILPTLADLEV